MGIFCAVASALGYSLRSFLYKILVKKGFDRNLIQFAYRAVSVPIGFALLAVFSQNLFSAKGGTHDYLLMLIPVTIGVVADLFYYKSVEKVDLSIAALISRMSPLISLVLGYVFFKEVPHLIAIIGVFVIVLTSLWLNSTMKKSINSTNFSKKDLGNLFASNILYTLIGLMMDDISGRIGTVQYFLFYSILNTFIFGLLSAKTGSFHLLKNKSTKSLLLLFVYPFIAATPFLTTIVAFSNLMAPVAYALTSFSLIFSIMLGYIFLGEKDNIKKKIVGSLTMLAGGYLTVN